jgi:hypothetical protein
MPILQSENWTAESFAAALFALPLMRVATVPTITVVMIDVMIVLGMTDTEKTDIEKTGVIDVIVQNRLLAAQNTTIVVPGLRPPGGRKKEGLQGMTMNDAETIKGVMIKKTATKIEMQDTRMGREVGPVECNRVGSGARALAES